MPRCEVSAATAAAVPAAYQLLNVQMSFFRLLSLSAPPRLLASDCALASDCVLEYATHVAPSNCASARLFRVSPTLVECPSHVSHVSHLPSSYPEISRFRDARAQLSKFSRCCLPHVRLENARVELAIQIIPSCAINERLVLLAEFG